MKSRKITKIIAFLAALVLLFSININATAFTSDIDATEKDIYSFIENDFGELLDIIVSNPEDYGVQDYIDDNFTANDISILEPVEFNEMNSQALKSTSDKIYHFPVMVKGKIVLIYDVIKSNEEYTSTLGSDFSPLMNSLVCADEDRANFYQDGYNLYASTADNIYEQEGNTVSVHGNDYIDSIKKSSIRLDNYNSYAFKRNEMYTESAVKSIQNQSKKAIAYSTAEPGGMRNLLNYPIVHQRIGSKQYGMCWAATVASMVRFEKPKIYPNLSAKNVCDHAGIKYDDGGTNKDSKKALTYYLGSPYVPTIKSVLSTNDIYTVINNIDPAYMQCRRKTGFLKYDYHAVALTGYSFTKVKKTIRIMDPAYESFKTCTRRNGDWTFAFGDSTFTWYKTIRLLYK